MKNLFGEQIVAARKKQDLSTLSLAESCGVSRSYITLIENGQRLPGRKVIPKIAQALGLETHVVVNWYLEDLREKLT
jgi:transcriptional regulator with XRE-family HTH domain